MAYNQPYYNGGYYPQYQNGAVPDMLNQYKGQYQQIPMMQQPIQQMPTTAQSTPTNDMIWVLSEGEAQSYPVAPNNSVILWDKNSDVVYIKSVNAQNVPSFRVLDYKERTAENSPKTPTEHKCTCGDKFATKEQINALEGKIDDLTAKYEEISKSMVEKPKTTTKKAKESEE